MKPLWQIRRRTPPLPDGQRRLEWSRGPVDPLSPPEKEKPDDARCRICQGLDPDTGPPADP